MGRSSRARANAAGSSSSSSTARQRSAATVGSASIRPGDFFGEIALVADRPRTATNPVHVLVIRDTDFRAMLPRTPQIALKVMQAVAERLPPGAT
jgi:CRP-like cAMP-binding protein